MWKVLSLYFKGIPTWSPWAFHPQISLGPSVNLNSKQMGLPYFPSVFTPLPQPQFELLLFFFLYPIFTHSSRAITSPLSPCFPIDRQHLQTLGSDSLGFESPSLLLVTTVVECGTNPSYFLCLRFHIYKVCHVG